MKARDVLLVSAFAAALILPCTSIAQGASDPKTKVEAEKCSGVAKSVQNDCQTSDPSQTETSEWDDQYNDGIDIPAGAPKRLVGGSLEPKKASRTNSTVSRDSRQTVPRLTLLVNSSQDHRSPELFTAKYYINTLCSKKYEGNPTTEAPTPETGRCLYEACVRDRWHSAVGGWAGGRALRCWAMLAVHPRALVKRGDAL
jgi:uncharacterized membrane protein